VPPAVHSSTCISISGSRSAGHYRWNNWQLTFDFCHPFHLCVSLSLCDQRSNLLTKHIRLLIIFQGRRSNRYNNNNNPEKIGRRRKQKILKLQPRDLELLLSLSIYPSMHPSQLFGKGFTGYSIMFYCSYRLAPKVDQIQHPPRWSLFSSGLLCLIHTHSHTHVRHGPLCVYRGNRKVDASTGILRLWSVTRPYRPCLNQNQISTQQVKKNIGRNCVGQKKTKKDKERKKVIGTVFPRLPPPLILPGPDRVSKVEDEKVTRQS
jgi:hypothetical protein